MSNFILNINGEEKRVNVDTVNINESQAAKYIKNSKVITAHSLAKETNVKISIANAYIQKIKSEEDSYA